MTHTSTEQPEALQAIRALREYIEAIPKEIADGLPAMPGIDGEWLDAIEQTLEASQARVPLAMYQRDTIKANAWRETMIGGHYDPNAIIDATEAAHGITQEKQG